MKLNNFVNLICANSNFYTKDRKYKTQSILVLFTSLLLVSSGGGSKNNSTT